MKHKRGKHKKDKHKEKWLVRKVMKLGQKWMEKKGENSVQ